MLEGIKFKKLFKALGIILSLYYFVPFYEGMVDTFLWNIYKIPIIGFSAGLFSLFQLVFTGTLIPYLVQFVFFLISWFLSYKIFAFVINARNSNE